MLLDCTNCGAPLDVKQDAWVVTCCYCKRTQTVRQKTKQAMPTPANWHAPQQWSPPPRMGAMVQPMHFDPTAAARKTARVIGCVVFAPILLAVIGAMVPVFLSLGGTKLFARDWDGKETFECTGNGDETIEDVNVTAKRSPAIVVNGNCKLTILRSKISGKNVIEVRENGRVTVKDSEITVKNRRGVAVDGNFGLTMQNSTLRIEAEAGQPVIALEADGNSSIELSESIVAIEGGSTVTFFVGKANASLVMNGGSVQAQGRDLVVEGPHEVEGVDLHKSKIVPPGAAGSASAPAPTGPMDPTCEAAHRCCIKTLGAGQCNHVRTVPPMACQQLLDSFRQAGKSRNIRCD
jgi:hypothetical protein